ncbi:hypothetical protein [Acidovorax sp. SUPP3334]|uniref:hypothetical protein n=1 Tax=Acidovorax sp. SUPP3334 TaxID=2920881 RepID=UPI0024E0606F|nr:hypothetical protein [Acidovorax sp. SUPP3334]
MAASPDAAADALPFAIFSEVPAPERGLRALALRAAVARAGDGGAAGSINVRHGAMPLPLAQHTEN